MEKRPNFEKPIKIFFDAILAKKFPVKRLYTKNFFTY